jgi:hypothetical protein
LGDYWVVEKVKDNDTEPNRNENLHVKSEKPTKSDF